MFEKQKYRILLFNGRTRTMTGHGISMSNKEDLEKLFQAADRNILCNTSYPFRKELFKKYQSGEDLFRNTPELSFYIHIPFCRQLCSFCEYTRFPAGNTDQETRYVHMLEDQIERYLQSHKTSKIYGLDIGGGTPTALSDDSFEHLLSVSLALENSGTKVTDYEKSLEFSFSTITERKLEMLVRYGFTRLSAGLQSADDQLLTENGRLISSCDRIADLMQNARSCGIRKINLDLMYGMHRQTDESIDRTLAMIARLMPEQVTVYETRYNKWKTVPLDITRESQYHQYCRLYSGLTCLGYTGRFGANTFSISGDDGLSSYIRSRMRSGIPYKGFGISAQSMSRSGISYGVLKNAGPEALSSVDILTEEDNYVLPARETAAKYVSVALYGGEFDLNVLSDILKCDAFSVFYDELCFLKERDLAELRDNRVVLTPEGFRYYGAAAVLFWSQEQKNAVLNY